MRSVKEVNDILPVLQAVLIFGRDLLHDFMLPVIFSEKRDIET